MRAPLAQVLVDLRQQVVGFLEEDRAEVGIDLVDETVQRIVLDLGSLLGGAQHLGGLLAQRLAPVGAIAFDRLRAIDSGLDHWNARSIIARSDCGSRCGSRRCENRSSIELIDAIAA